MTISAFALTTVAGLVLALGPVTSDAQAASDGRALYLKHCRTCHGTTGTPSKQALRETPKIAKLDQAFLEARSDDSLRIVITRGAGKDMKAFKDKLSREEIDAIVVYVRSLATARRS